MKSLKCAWDFPGILQTKKVRIMKKYIVVRNYEGTPECITRAFESLSDAMAFAALMNKSETKKYYEYFVADILTENSDSL